VWPEAPVVQSDAPTEQARRFFNGLARRYRPVHGDARALLAKQMTILLRHGDFRPEHTVVDLGCGPGFHLRELAPFVRRGVGIDFAPAMVREAARRAARVRELGWPYAGRLEFQVDDASRLETLGDCSADRVICVGALTHIPDKASVFREAARVLRPSGRFLCLASNGDYLWHTIVGPLLGLETQHLPSDRMPVGTDAVRFAREAGLVIRTVGYWPFVPCSDMPVGVGWLMRLLELLGRAGSRRFLWGGLLVVAVKPIGAERVE
jgi:ubiquinone/menaquinone biosynthesis C-methylase UbiE